MHLMSFAIYSFYLTYIHVGEQSCIFSWCPNNRDGDSKALAKEEVQLFPDLLRGWWAVSMYTWTKSQSQLLSLSGVVNNMVNGVSSHSDES